MNIHMNLDENSYDIVIERGILAHAGEHLNLQRRVLIVTDTGVPKEYAQTVANQCESPVICTVEEGEVVQLTDGSLAEETRLNAKDGTGDQIEYTISDEELMKKIELILPSETGTVIKYDKRLGLTLIAQEAYEEFINRIFTCERVTYHPTTGKVNGMVFTELDTNPVTP